MGSEDTFKHPYFPRNLVIPHYRPNKISIQELLGVFFSLVLLVFIVTWICSTKRKFSVGYRFLLCWFTICGFIHTILEGYFGFNHATLAGGSSYLAEMCMYHSIQLMHLTMPIKCYIGVLFHELKIKSLYRREYLNMFL